LAGTVAVFARGERWGEFAVIRDGKLLLARSVAGPALATDTALLGDLKRNLAVYSSQGGQDAPAALYVAEAPGLTDLAGRLSPSLTVPVQGFDPLTGLAELPPGPRGRSPARSASSNSGLRSCRSTSSSRANRNRRPTRTAGRSPSPSPPWC